MAGFMINQGYMIFKMYWAIALFDNFLESCIIILNNDTWFCRNENCKIEKILSLTCKQINNVR